ncbi:MAG TPA: hypothetical protein VFM90_12625 [Cyclobacteriaceae bacterium]|nr:hypothetical protein [Cyclobacteriaceae bacterium]
MPGLSVLKKYFRAAAIIGIFAALTLYLPDKQTTGGRDIYFGMPVSEASIVQEFFSDADFVLQQLNGVKVLNPDTGKFTYYFEYIANKQDTLKRISALPFLKDNRPTSLRCELMNASFDPLDNSALTQQERDATSFFWQVAAGDFIFYECYKSPVKHTLLLSKTTDRILHRVEAI